MIGAAMPLSSPRRSLGSNRAAGWLVAFAVVAQAVMAVPLAFHFAAIAGLDRTLGVFPLCSAGSDRSDGGGQSGDDHEHCLNFCQGVFGAPALLPIPVALTVAALFVVIVFASRRPELRAVGRVAGYITRGPPFAAA
ncbi:MAG TPA: DUF2946 family protein [Dongiaceae bacterium]|nr:DUF2946 family protein [Dongiaceae bacterium]